MAQSDEKCDEISKIQQTYSIQFQQQSTQRKFFKLSKQSMTLYTTIEFLKED
jgi:hypothetical protein